MAINFYNCRNLCPFWYPMCTSGSGIGASFGFTKALFLGCIFLLWHRCFPLDFTGALFCVSTRNSMKLQFLFELCEYLFVLVANRTFLPEFLMLNISFGCCRHSVSNTFVQLTEGRSARDQPTQPPAKKKGLTEPAADEILELHSVRRMVSAEPASERIFVFLVLTGPAADEILELHCVRLMVFAGPASDKIFVLECQVSGLAWACHG